MTDFDARLWRALRQIVLVLGGGILVVLLGFGPRPERIHSVFGLAILLTVGAMAVTALLRLPARVRTVLPALPRNRPWLTTAAGMLAVASLLFGWWTVANAVSPGTLSPLDLALTVLVATAGVTTLATLRRGRNRSR